MAQGFHKRGILPRLDNVPTIEVVVPCFNYGHYLEACVGSILEQKGVVVSVHIIDDASTDDSAEAALALASSDTRIRVTVHRKNMGHIATYNEGLLSVGAKYSVLLSADDMLPKNALQRAVSIMEKHPEVGLVYGYPQTFCDTPEEGSVYGRGYSTWEGRDWISAQVRRGLSIIYSPEAVVRTSIQKAVGGYNDLLPHTADLEMWLRFADVSNIARVNGHLQAFRRVHNNSMMHTSFASLPVDLGERLKAYESFFDKSHQNPSQVHVWSQEVRKVLAVEAIDLAVSTTHSNPEEFQLSLDLLDFAHRTNPGNLVLRGNKELEILRNPRAKFVDRLSVVATSVERRLRVRKTWTRWQKYGI